MPMIELAREGGAKVYVNTDHAVLAQEAAAGNGTDVFLTGDRTLTVRESPHEVATTFNTAVTSSQTPPLMMRPATGGR